MKNVSGQLIIGSTQANANKEVQKSKAQLLNSISGLIGIAVLIFLAVGLVWLIKVTFSALFAVAMVTSATMLFLFNCWKLLCQKKFFSEEEKKLTLWEKMIKDYKKERRRNQKQGKETISFKKHMYLTWTIVSIVIMMIFIASLCLLYFIFDPQYQVFPVNAIGCIAIIVATIDFYISIEGLSKFSLIKDRKIGDPKLSWQKRIIILDRFSALTTNVFILCLFLIKSGVIQ